MNDKQKDLSEDSETSSESEEEDDVKPVNIFKNDGSFLEMFKKMQESSQNSKTEKHENSSSEDKIASANKRRSVRVLPTGLVKKTKLQEDEQLEKSNDAWSHYMTEVKQYREKSCEEEGKTRPLVK